MKNLGPYSILELLGRGGQGVVYLAEDTRLKRRVALKVIEGSGLTASSDQLERFRREAGAASKLDHPNICGIHEAGEADGIPYIAMRFVEGETLAEVIETAQQPNAQGTEATPSSRDQIHAILGRIEKVARALHVAHERGLIHRDIKPGNIMLTTEGEPIVLDFGLARDEEAGDHSLTHSGDLLGTPAYMSPEQLMAQRIPLDRRTDVYSLGATLYECLTLRRPFEAATRAELYQRIMTHEASSAGSHNRAIPADLQVVIATAMEKDRNRRYQTASAFAEDLRRVRQFEPIHAKPIGTVLRLKRWAQRHPAASVAVVGLVLALAVTLGFLEQMRRNLRHTRAVALASAAVEVMHRDPTLSLMLAREAVDLEHNAGTLSPLHQALAQHRERAVLRHDGIVRGSYAAPDGRVLTVSNDKTARIWSRDGALLRVLQHETGVRCGAFSPDGSTIATASDDGKLHFWTAAGDLRSECQAHARAILAMQFAPAGEPAVLTGSEDGSARLWDLDGAPLARFDHGSRVWVATFSPDGQYVLTAANYLRTNDAPTGDFTTAMLWTRSGQLHARLQGHADSIEAAVFSPGGDRILTASNDKTARLWDLQGNQLQMLQHPVKVWDAAFQPRAAGNRLLTACLDGRLRIWDLDGRIRSTLHVHGSAVTTVVASGNGERILTSSWDQTARLLDAEGDLLAEFTGHTATLNDRSVSFLPDGEGVLTRSLDHTARLWDTQAGGLPVLRGHAAGVSSATFSPDQRYILTGVADATVRLWSVAGRQLRAFSGQTEWVNQAAFSHDGSMVASAADDGTTRLWRTEDGELQHVLVGSTARGVHGVAFAPDDQLLAQCSSDGVTLLWDVRSGRQLGSLGAVGEATFWFGGFSPTRPWLVTAQAGGTVKVWDVANPARATPVHEFHPSSATVFEAVFSPDGERVAAASGDGTAWIWDLRGGDPVVCRGHQGQLMGVAFSPDGSTLATASRDGTARIWDLTGRELAVLRGHDGTLWDVEFSPDGRRLVTASFDMTVRTWIVDSVELLEVVDKRLDRLGRTFTPAELKRFGELLGR